MRVLHVYKTYYPDTFGGIEQVIRQIALSTRQLGVDAKIFTVSRQGRQTPRIEQDGVPVLRAPVTIEIASNAMSLRAFGEFRQAAAWADIIQYHFPWPFGDLLHLAAAAGKPALATYHSDVVRQKALMHIYRPLMHRFLASMGAIVATSPNYAESSTILQRHRQRVTVIPIGVDEESFPTPSNTIRETWRERVGENFFLFVGVLRYYKGLHILLEAIRETGLSLVIVGAGPEEERLRQQAKAAGLHRVIFVGAVTDEDKMALIALARAMVFPSHLRSEAYGVTLVEAAMCGKPMISTEIGTGTSFVNLDRETGLVLPPDDVHALREALLWFARNDDAVAAMGMRARARFEERFTATRMAHEYIRLYKELAHSTLPSQAFQTVSASDTTRPFK
ncbi:glycosyltransferase [Cupriavidus cauae]|uniref:Glycosyltransferase n=1 Tax=Cupriavidus cauae TaxID=2608999 RepID=A0A5M8AA07_9BURK|nr:glycosyltransferase [Cupriavidus cauae]KAA6119151.1 glycosyltransferase [Cupriavidus cauae]